MARGVVQHVRDHVLQRIFVGAHHHRLCIASELHVVDAGIRRVLSHVPHEALQVERLHPQRGGLEGLARRRAAVQHLHCLLHALDVAVAGVARLGVQHHQRLQRRHDFVADRVPLVLLLLGTDVLALHVVVHALQQLGQHAGQQAQLVAAAQVAEVELVLWIFFNLFTGNNDSHAKNLSLYRMPGHGIEELRMQPRFVLRLAAELAEQMPIAVGQAAEALMPALPHGARDLAGRLKTFLRSTAKKTAARLEG